jgi:hypothetical protein
MYFKDLDLTFTPLKKQVYDFEVKVTIPGGKPVKIQIRARADVPNVSVKQDAFDYGGNIHQHL